MNKEFNRYKVTIAGESYFLVSDESEEHVKVVSGYVDEQMKLIAQSGFADDLKRIAVLVALQCASKMMASERANEQVMLSSERLIEQVDRELEQLKGESW